MTQRAHIACDSRDTAEHLREFIAFETRPGFENEMNMVRSIFKDESDKAVLSVVSQYHMIIFSQRLLAKRIFTGKIDIDSYNITLKIKYGCYS